MLTTLHYHPRVRVGDAHPLLALLSVYSHHLWQVCSVVPKYQLWNRAVSNVALQHFAPFIPSLHSEGVGLGDSAH